MTRPEHDALFNAALSQVTDFHFGAKVAGVFDDMVARSVPFYLEIQRMIAELAADHAQPDSHVYDLGCATGATLLCMDQAVDPDIRFIGIDDSAAMLAKCREKLTSQGLTRPFSLQQADLNGDLRIERASVVVLCLTLQFIRPIYREKLLHKILTGLNTGGVLLLVEKVLAEDSALNRRFIDYYYRYKRRNHYSELEIAQKREALENVLIPYKLSENIALLRDVGFEQCEVFFKWYNFAGLIARKPPCHPPYTQAIKRA
ncbi:MAG: carboxy-S-adenosyl-L-methionine synthase CmoA [Methylococcales bacterium]|nr:carboxy-S-adenosyl-L-methionine synthase CmoA [Methylococcales bacterium]